MLLEPHLGGVLWSCHTPQVKTETLSRILVASPCLTKASVECTVNVIEVKIALLVLIKAINFVWRVDILSQSSTIDLFHI